MQAIKSDVIFVPLSFPPLEFIHAVEVVDENVVDEGVGVVQCLVALMTKSTRKRAPGPVSIRV